MNERVLLLAYEDFRRFGLPILVDAGYHVNRRDPAKYSGLGRQKPDLVIQEVPISWDKTTPDIELTKRVVDEIIADGLSISMLVVTAIPKRQDTRDFMRVLRGLGGGKYAYKKTPQNSDELLGQVKVMLGRK